MSDNERRARWVGWSRVAHPNDAGVCLWENSDTGKHNRLKHPNYETSFNACKELIEKAKGFRFICLLYWNPDGTCTFEIEEDKPQGGYRELFDAEAETPELAICKAIDKLMDFLESTDE